MHAAFEAWLVKFRKASTYLVFQPGLDPQSKPRRLVKGVRKASRWSASPAG